MPSIHEFITQFGVKEALIVGLIVVIIVVFRERERISRRKS